MLLLLLTACADPDVAGDGPKPSDSDTHADDPGDSGGADSGEPADSGAPDDTATDTDADTAAPAACDDSALDLPRLADLWDGRARFVVDDAFVAPSTADLHAETSTVWHDGQWWMYHRVRSAGCGSNGIAIGLSTSADGDVWTPWSAGAPVIPCGDASLDGNGAYAPSVVHDGSQFVMLYEAAPTSGGQTIALATSTDGTAWTKHGTVLSSSLSWEAGNVGTPSLTRLGGTWVVGYHGWTGRDADDTLARGIATGSDLRALTRFGDPVLAATAGTWTSVGIGRADIVEQDGAYWMVYEGLAGSPLCRSVTRTGWGVARSTDLRSWQQGAADPLALDTDNVCGEDMPAWQTLGDRLYVIATKPTADGVRRWKPRFTDRAAIAATPSGEGTWIATADGRVHGLGDACDHGDAPGADDVVGFAPTPDGRGYWLAQADGTVRAFGTATDHGDASGTALNQPVVGIAATPTGDGYWLVAADGGVFTYGDALYYGSTGDTTLNAPMVAMAATPSGAGYWLVGADGGVFCYGDARFYGSGGDLGLSDVVGVARTPSGAGYWLAQAGGGVLAFGDAVDAGDADDLALVEPIVGLAPTPSGAGYWLLGGDGGVFTFGDAGYLGNAAP